MAISLSTSAITSGTGTSGNSLAVNVASTSDIVVAGLAARGSGTGGTITINSSAPTVLGTVSYNMGGATSSQLEVILAYLVPATTGSITVTSTSVGGLGILTAAVYSGADTTALFSGTGSTSQGSSISSATVASSLNDLCICMGAQYSSAASSISGYTTVSGTSATIVRSLQRGGGSIGQWGYLFTAPGNAGNTIFSVNSAALRQRLLVYSNLSRAVALPAIRTIGQPIWWG